MSPHPFPAARLSQTVAHTLTQSGFSAFKHSALAILVHIFELYLTSLARTASSVCNHAGRSKPNTYDLDFAMAQMKIDLVALHDFISSGWTEQLNHLDFDLRMRSVAQIPGHSVRHLNSLASAATSDDTWVLPPAYPIHVPAQLIIDHIHAHPSLDSPLYITAIPTTPLRRALNSSTPAKDPLPRPVPTTTTHIPPHLPPLIGPSTHHLSAPPHSDPWSKPKHPSKPAKKVLKIGGSPKQMASWIKHVDPSHELTGSSSDSMEVDMNLVHECHSQIPSSSVLPTPAVKPNLVVSTNPYRAMPQTRVSSYSGSLRRRPGRTQRNDLLERALDAAANATPPNAVLPVVSLVTSTDSLFARAGAGLVHGGTDLDPVYPRADVCPSSASAVRGTAPKMDEVRCTCEKPSVDDGSLLVQCGGACRVWFHGRCVGVSADGIVNGGVVEFLCGPCRTKKASAPPIVNGKASK